MSWSRKGAILGFILGLVVIFVIGKNHGATGSLTLWDFTLWPGFGALSGWAAGKILAK